MLNIPEVLCFPFCLQVNHRSFSQGNVIKQAEFFLLGFLYYYLFYFIIFFFFFSIKSLNLEKPGGRSKILLD